MGRKILVVDDDEGIIEAFRITLQSLGYDVETSTDADVLFSISKDKRPDLILLDVLLSGADGRELCKYLKQQRDTKKIPIVMISAHPSAVKSVKKVGADDFLAKPFEIDELSKIIENHIT